MIEIKKLTKKYNDKKALDDVSIVFEEGKIYGLLGNNGAGKTTLLRIITNRVFLTNGEVLINGISAIENEEAQSQIFCVTEKDKYPNDLRVKDLFVWEKRFYEKFDIEYAKEIAKKFELDINKKPKELSTGYYTILKVVLAIASNSKIMILDEPVLGIDSLYREVFYDVLSTHHKKHKNLIIIATHLIDEVERVLEQVVIISKGKIIKNDEINSLTKGKRLNEVYVKLLKEVKNDK